MKKGTITQASEYKSVEEKVFTPIGKRLQDFGQAFYGGAAIYFRIPTTVRKIMNVQTITTKNEGDLSNSFVLGGFIGLISTPAYIFKNNSFELETLLYSFLATNVISGIYELGRLSTSRQEHVRLKASKLEEKAR
ncbi:MAG: hypothetical protein AABY15_07460 [Nanoarchaeota archaeon]